MQIFTKSTRLPEECPVATGSTLLMVYARFIVTWSWSAVAIREDG